ncbi:MAG: hypothetical protein QE509_15080 [Gammaproteobacteria bacterium]|jgi:hypothetical protein|nr:hypothetical protein [Gammaproteobacteria bacterium]
MKKTTKSVAAAALTAMGMSGTLLAPINAEAAVVQWDFSSGGNANSYKPVQARLKEPRI